MHGTMNIKYVAMLTGNLLQKSRRSFLPLQGSKEEVFAYPEYGSIKFLTKSVTNWRSAMRLTSKDCNLQETISSQKVQIGSTVHPASYSIGTVGPLVPGRAAGVGGVKLTKQLPSTAEVKASGSTPSTPIWFHFVHRRKFSCNWSYNIQGVSGGIVNILGGDAIDYSE